MIPCSFLLLDEQTPKSLLWMSDLLRCLCNSALVETRKEEWVPSVSRVSALHSKVN